MKQLYQKKSLGFKTVFRTLSVCLVFALQYFTAAAQCPPNIDFEEGNFNGWQCLTGTFNAGKVSVNPTAPIPGRHDIISALTTPAFDNYGGFPKLCPNGSNYSVRFGVQNTGTNADGASYTFTIPPGADKFNLIYHYAIVINNGGGHSALDQPRLMVSVKNLTDNTTDNCSSFDIAYSNSNPLPGFEPPGPSMFKWKPWAANSINLDGNAGKTIEITFIATGCGLTGGTHFGYAYVDINSTCSSAFTGATFCPDDAFVKVSAPSGYQDYKWFNNNFTQVLGTGQILTLNPPPLAGDSVFVELTPYNGYGCLDTLSAKLWDTLTVKANAGPDQAICDNNPVQLGEPPSPDRIYNWTPATGLNDATISNPIATPSVTTTYTLKVTNVGGGCATYKEATVEVDIMNDVMELIGVDTYCKGNGQSATLVVQMHDSIQWYQDGVEVPGAAGQHDTLVVTQTGAYHAKVFSDAGCERTTRIQQINIYEQPIAGFTVNKATQCNTGNEFIFTNTSTLAAGTPNYEWDLGDGTVVNSPDVTHSYPPGKYTVVMTIKGPGGCSDMRKMDVVVNADPTSSFNVDIPQQCFKNNWFIFTNNSTVSQGILTYTWDFGDGKLDNSNDIAHQYTQPGTYLVKLTAKETNGGCVDDSIFTIVVQQSPVTDFAINNNIQCFPGHQFILTNNTAIQSDPLSYTWDMGDGVIKTDKEFTYSYTKAGNYTIKLVSGTAFGCKDSAVHNVVVHPTPTADFTVKPVCENLQVPIINRTFNNTTSTVNYLWDFGNTHTDVVKTPVYSYPLPGTYPLSLTVSTAQCPISYNTKTVFVTIDANEPGIMYPDKDAAFNYPEQLSARNLGSGANVTWTPATSLSNRFSYTPTFVGIAPQLYTIQIKTATGCITVDTQLVKTHKKIEIYVPTTFTPNGDGYNDRLRPVLIGFVKVNYFRVFDRWGKLLFTMNSDKPGWDGRLNGRPSETQTIVWMIEAVDVDGVVHSKTGTTVLIH